MFFKKIDNMEFKLLKQTNREPDLNYVLEPSETSASCYKEKFSGKKNSITQKLPAESEDTHKQL